MRAILVRQKTDGISFFEVSMKAPILEMTLKLKNILEQAEQTAIQYRHYEGKLLLSLIEVDKAKAYLCFGYTHLTPYCRKELGLSEDMAAIFVRVVRKSLEVPELANAVASGEIQITKAKTIASVITKENKTEWLDRAAHLSKHELERKVLKASGRETSTVSFELTPEEQASFRRVQEILCAKLDHFPSKEEAFAWITEFTLDKIDPLRKADRSRASRNPSVSDQVVLRDQNRCQAEMPDGTICGEAKWTHQHHLIPKEHGGRDTVENLITLCASHHRAIHAEMDH